MLKVLFCCCAMWPICKEINIQDLSLPSATKLRRLCFYKCLSVHGGGIPACLAGGIPACLAAGLWGGGGIPACLAGFQAHTQGGSLGGSGWGGSPGPQPRGKLRGIWQGVPVPGGGACYWGGACSWGGTCSGGCLLRGGLETPPPADGYRCGRYASYWNAFLFKINCTITT